MKNYRKPFWEIFLLCEHWSSYKPGHSFLVYCNSSVLKVSRHWCIHQYTHCTPWWFCELMVAWLPNPHGIFIQVTCGIQMFDSLITLRVYIYLYTCTVNEVPIRWERNIFIGYSPYDACDIQELQCLSVMLWKACLITSVGSLTACKSSSCFRRYCFT